MKHSSLGIKHFWKTLLFVAPLVLSACGATGQPSEQQIESAKAEAEEVRSQLYVPQGTSLLVERLTYSTDPDLYPGCVRVLINIAYQSPNDFDDVLTEYREKLVEMGWELSPDHRHDQNDVDFFQLGPEALLTIAEFPVRPDLLPPPTPNDISKQTLPIYYLLLAYYDPSRHECSG